ncbi:MAG TPA: 50S ribosomal protein L23 [Candidatus Paceibacterota bacterium]
MATDLKTKYSNVILRPRITEKATALSEKGVYVFEIAPEANKISVAKAIKAYFDVTPIKVRIVLNPSKNVVVRGKRGVKSGVKKAYVYLKKGDKIE